MQNARVDAMRQISKAFDANVGARPIGVPWNDDTRRYFFVA